MHIALREQFLTPSNSLRERYNNLVVSKARLIDYMLEFGVDGFFNQIVKHYRNFITGGFREVEQGNSGQMTLTEAQNRVRENVVK